MFDIDGTLVDSFGFDEECYLKTAEIVLGMKISSHWSEYKHTTDSGILDEAIERYKVPGDKIQIQQKFKKVLIDLVSENIRNNPCSVREIKGAACFIRYLCRREDCTVAIATGGWKETAKLKLEAAGIDVAGYAFASSSDYSSRVDIMRAAELKASSNISFKSKTFFGDASWDRDASEILNYRFILVGNRIEHKYQIKDFKDRESIISILDV